MKCCEMTENAPKENTTLNDAAIKALIAQGVATALAEYEANRGSGNGDDSHNSGSGRRTERCYGSVMASKPKTMQDAIEIANDLMDQKIRTFAKRQDENKRKLDNDNQAQQQPPKKQNVARAYSAGSSEKKEYAGTLPLCNKCKFHHNSPCTVKCANCKRVGHLTRNCRSPVTTNNQRTITCYECGSQGHYRSDCPELKNQNHGNQARGAEARGMVYAL
ncbi:reverse transcriptase domain-containing protein [Tanacetum coccineum]